MELADVELPEVTITPEDFLALSPTKRLMIVRDHIDRNPEHHNQTFWGTVGYYGCSTQMCVAGWASHLAGDVMRFGIVDDYDHVKYLNEVVDSDGHAWDVECRGQNLLGLSDDQVSALFYSGNENFRVIIEGILEENGE